MWPVVSRNREDVLIFSLSTFRRGVNPLPMQVVEQLYEIQHCLILRLPTYLSSLSSRMVSLRLLQMVTALTLECMTIPSWRVGF